MGDARWDTLEDIFLRAVDRPADERAGFLDRACADDPGLRAEVEAMLAAEEAGGDFRWIDRLGSADAEPPTAMSTRPWRRH